MSKTEKEVSPYREMFENKLRQLNDRKIINDAIMIFFDQSVEQMIIASQHLNLDHLREPIKYTRKEYKVNDNPTPLDGALHLEIQQLTTSKTHFQNQANKHLLELQQLRELNTENVASRLEYRNLYEAENKRVKKFEETAKLAVNDDGTNWDEYMSKFHELLKTK